MDKLFLGVLSGTSLDAIDVATFKFTATTASLQHSLSYPIPLAIKQACLQLSEIGVCKIEELGMLDSSMGLLFADAVMALLQQYNIPTQLIAAIGSHGQNICHQPKLPRPFTLQIGDPNIIAATTGITTVADFRRLDIALGGQGAPLAPGFHAAVFRSTAVDRVIVNIGGISNITVLPCDSSASIAGFDIGPGNCLMDAWTTLHFNLPYDQDGKIATSGTPVPTLLQHLRNDPYFTLAPPKSTGREYFNLAWLNKYLAQLQQPPSPADVLATLLQLTSASISAAIKSCKLQAEIYLCGGGVYNTALLTALAADLGQAPLLTSALGIAPDWVEAGLFAWLARQRLLGLPGNVPSVTGARQSAPLGGVWQLHSCTSHSI